MGGERGEAGTVEGYRWKERERREEVRRPRRVDDGVGWGGGHSRPQSLDARPGLHLQFIHSAEVSFLLQTERQLLVQCAHSLRGLVLTQDEHNVG